MANSISKDLQRAKDLRKMAKEVQNDTARERLLAAAGRSEQQAGKKATKIGKKRPSSTGVPGGGFTR